MLVSFSDLHFVRCIKPNRAKRAHAFDRSMVETQLRCSGVFEAVRVIGMGFPDRVPHFQVYGQYARLLPEDERPAVDVHGTPEEGEKAAVEQVLARRARSRPSSPDLRRSPLPQVLAWLEVEAELYAVGFTKVFFKAGVLPRLRKLKELHGSVVERAASTRSEDTTLSARLVAPKAQTAPTEPQSAG